jgi:diacylglycerol kinase (ATP)
MSEKKDRRRILFVYNPIAGGKDKSKVITAIEAFCVTKDLEYAFLETEGKDDHIRIQEMLHQYTWDVVVAVGGDGTVNLVGKTLVSSTIPLGIIPEGSANGLAKDLKIPQKLEDALQVIATSKPRPIDTLKINGRDSFHMSDFGFNARVIRRFSESIIRGKISYVWYGLIEFFTFKPFSYFIETPMLKYEGDAFMMIVTNSNQFGTELIINPLGKIDDGFFEIIIIKPFSRWKSAGVLHRLVTNKINMSPYSKLIRCKEAVIYNRDNESFHIDGEPEELGEKIEIKIVPKGLYVLRP